jgi:hypothetical protein
VNHWLGNGRLTSSIDTLKINMQVYFQHSSFDMLRMDAKQTKS